MENSPKKSALEIEEEAQKQRMNPEVKETESQDDDTPKVSREHDFTHTHPGHAKHKRFGIDHEPGAAY